MGVRSSKKKRKGDGYSNIEDDVPPGMIRIFINGINTKIHCYPHITVGNFVSFIREELQIPSKCSMILIHNHLLLQPETDKYKDLTYYNIKNGSCLLLCISQLNKSPKLTITKLSSKSNQRNFRNNCCSMTINEGYIETIQDLDILTYETSQFCLKMQCGHGMPQKTLYQYTLSQLKNGVKVVKCPHIQSYNHTKCDQIWYYPLIKNTLLYESTCTTSIPWPDVLKLDVMIAENMIKNECRTANCKQCDTWIYKDKIDSNGDSEPRTFCPRCENVFCWQCGFKWENLNSAVCVKNCVFNFEAEVLDILESCPTKRIGEVSGVPAIRCCPKCLQLVNHTAACKHVQCKTCKCNFCFVCMGVYDGEWHCGDSSTICPVAAIGIPKIQK